LKLIAKKENELTKTEEVNKNCRRFPNTSKKFKCVNDRIMELF